jgi:teichuronic acid biosynthesis glycosyltransferase TuaC
MHLYAPYQRWRHKPRLPSTTPRFTLLPAISGPINPALIARAVMPLAKKLHAETPFDMVDAQFFYPDGPAAAAIARALGLPSCNQGARF